MSVIFDLFSESLLDLLGNPLIVGLVFLFILCMLFAAIGLPILSVAVIMGGFVYGIVNYEVFFALPLWVLGIFAILIGLTLYFTFYQLFKS
jgi:hypothetical protein